MIETTSKMSCFTMTHQNKFNQKSTRLNNEGHAKDKFVSGQGGKKKKADPSGSAFSFGRMPAMTYSPTAKAAVPSACVGLTSEFGKGSGGTPRLASPANF